MICRAAQYAALAALYSLYDSPFMHYQPRMFGQTKCTMKTTKPWSGVAWARVR